MRNATMRPAAVVAAWRRAYPLPPRPPVEVPLRSTPGPATESTCRCPVPDAPPWRLCMLPTAHAGACLPVPTVRGLAVR